MPRYIEKKIKIYDYYNNYITIDLEKIKDVDLIKNYVENKYPIISSTILYKNKQFLNPIYQTKYKKLIECELIFRNKKWENINEIEKIIKLIE
jgi:hypothetical protein